jgi:hypothetical protein
MTNPVVKVNVSLLVAPTPSALQKSGALISMGATNTAQGTKSFLTQLSDLTPLLAGSHAISTLTYVGGNVVAVTASPHGFTIGDTIPLTISGAAPSGYNVTALCTITGASTFQYPVASNPGANTTPGIYTEEDVAELVAMATTFFAQGSGQGVYVLECGAGNATDGVNFLTTWIGQNPGTFYSYLVPRFWDGNAAFLALLATLNATTSQTYFFITTTLATYGGYPATDKCAFLMIEAPSYGVWPANALTAISWGGGSGGGTVTATTTTNHGVAVGQWFQITGVLPASYNGYFQALPGTVGNTLVYALATNPGAETQLGTLVQSQYAQAALAATEFSAAAPFQVTLNYAPNPSNRVTPLNLAFLNGVTPFPTQGNASLISTLQNANVNMVATAAAGGSSATILQGGNMQDGNPFNYWYSVDWTAINVPLQVTAALINGSNNPANPIYYDQAGINTLQSVAGGTMAQGVANGLVLNPIKQTTLTPSQLQAALNAGTFSGYTVVNADPFADYVTTNPNDYKAGIYKGFSIEYTPLRGFSSVTFNVTVSGFAL